MHVSPSQIATWRDCPRKWAYSRARDRVETAATRFGTDTHSLLEGWLGRGEPPDPATREGSCAIAGLPFLPPPGGDVGVEVPINIHHDGVHYLGFADLIYGYEPGRCVVVHDHKTTSSLDWAKTGEQLADDPQRVIYSHWAALTFAVPYVIAVWLYLQRRPPRARPVPVLESSAAIAERFAALHEREGRAIAAAHESGLPPEAYPPNLLACGYYGDCPYRGECHLTLSPTERQTALVAQIRK